MDEMIDETHAIRVLVVDDNVDAGETMGEALEFWGYQARVVFDGKSAVSLAMSWRPEAVLLDIGLPGIDGYEVARQLRKSPGLEKALLIALTGYGQDKDRERSAAAGFDSHLVKPVDFDRLQQVLSQGLTPRSP